MDIDVEQLDEALLPLPPDGAPWPTEQTSDLVWRWVPAYPSTPHLTARLITVLLRLGWLASPGATQAVLTVLDTEIADYAPPPASWSPGCASSLRTIPERPAPAGHAPSTSWTASPQPATKQRSGSSAKWKPYAGGRSASKSLSDSALAPRPAIGAGRGNDAVDDQLALPQMELHMIAPGLLHSGQADEVAVGAEHEPRRKPAPQLRPAH